MPSNSTPNPHQIDQSAAQERPESSLGGPPSTSHPRDSFYDAILDPSGRFWAPLGTQLGAEAGSRIPLFRSNSGKNAEKEGPGAVPGRTPKNDKL